MTPSARPAAPTVTVAPNGTDLQFNWVAPASAGQAVLWSDSAWGTSDHSTEAANGLGGSCVDNLTANNVTIEAYAYSTNGGASWTVTDTGTTSATITGYDPADFDFRLTAINTGGLWSEMLRVNQNGTFHDTSTFEGPTATGSGTARAEIVNHAATGCAFDAAATKFINATSTPQANVHFPHGLLDFTLINCMAGETAEIKITWPSSLAGGAYWKDKTSISAGWEEFDTTGCTDDGCAAINGSEVTIHVQDGGAFDLDTTPGTIRDPNGIALPKVLTGGAPIPALPAPLIALTALLAALAGWRLHRARVAPPQG